MKPCDFKPSDVPRPKTVDDYVNAYRANLEEARRELQRAAQAVRVLWDQGLICDEPHPETKEVRQVCKGDVAKKSWGDFVRWNADVEHWRERLMEASAPGFEVPKPFKPEPRERTVADVARELEQWRARQVGEDDGEDFTAEVS